MKEHFLTTGIYIHLGVFAAVTILWLVLRSLIPRLASKLGERFKIPRDLIDTLNRHIDWLLTISYFILALVLLFSVPLIKEYAPPVLDYPILDIETLQLSLHSVAKGVVSFYILLLMTKILRTCIRIYLYYRSNGEEYVSTIDILIYNTALIIIVTLALSIMGISWKLLLPIAGALGIGIGFGIQDIANNFISGFVILTSRTVKRGDWITVGDNFGQIVDVGMRTSTIRTMDNIDIIIPNSHMISKELINWSYTDNIVRIHIPVGVSYNSDVTLVRDTLLEVAQKSPYILKYPTAETRFLEFGDSSLNFELLIWIDIKQIKIPSMKSIVNYMLWNAFKEKGIQLPFPQRDVWFRNALSLEEKQKDADLVAS